MDDKNRSRQLDIQLTLVGLWNTENNTYSYFFHPDNKMDLIVGGLPIGEFDFEIITKEEDKPSIKITNHQHRSGEPQIKEYIIEELDRSKGVLRLLTDYGAEMSFRRHKVGF